MLVIVINGEAFLDRKRGSPNKNPRLASALSPEEKGPQPKHMKAAPKQPEMLNLEGKIIKFKFREQ